MTVLKGEGTVPILYGSATIVSGPTSHGGYLARPDLGGAWPTVLLVPSAWGITSAAKDVARRLARWGLAVVAVDLYRGRPPARKASMGEAATAAHAIPDRRALADVEDIVEFVTNPAGFWSNAEHGLGFLGIGDGGRIAVLAARGLAGTSAIALVSAPLDSPPNSPDRPGVAELLPRIDVPSMVLVGREDERVPVERVMELRTATPRAEWVLYGGAGHDFLDDYLESWDPAASKDAVERLSEFFVEHLPPGPA